MVREEIPSTQNMSYLTNAKKCNTLCIQGSNKLHPTYEAFFLTPYGYFWYTDILVTTSGSATRQYGEGGFPSKMNCSRAVTRSAETMTNPCKKVNHNGNQKDCTVTSHSVRSMNLVKQGDLMYSRYLKLVFIKKLLSSLNLNLSPSKSRRSLLPALGW